METFWRRQQTVEVRWLRTFSRGDLLEGDTRPIVRLLPQSISSRKFVVELTRTSRPWLEAEVGLSVGSSGNRGSESVRTPREGLQWRSCARPFSRRRFPPNGTVDRPVESSPSASRRRNVERRSSPGSTRAIQDARSRTDEISNAINIRWVD